MRNTLLVGSLPFTNEEEAMKRGLDLLGESLFCLPDGEIGLKSEKYPLGHRATWVIHAIDQCIADTNSWGVVKKGDFNKNGLPNDYDSLYKLRPKRSPQEMVDHLNFHYHEFFQENYPIFQRLREEHNLPNLKFQVGVPTGLAISLFALQSFNIFRYIDTFNQRLAFEVNQILTQAPDDVVIQIEIPAELGLVYKLPNFLSGWVLKSLFGFIEYISSPAKIGIHMCYGDLNNKSLTHPKTLGQVVDFTNKLIDKWPQKHQLVYIHFPLAEGDIPPSLNKDYYQPLQQIRLPEQTRLIAGFVHEGRSFAELQQIQQIIEDICSFPVGIACSCGLGRRSPEVADQLMKQMRELSQES